MKRLHETGKIGPEEHMETVASLIVDGPSGSRTIEFPRPDWDKPISVEKFAVNVEADPRGKADNDSKNGTNPDGRKLRFSIIGDWIAGL